MIWAATCFKQNGELQEQEMTHAAIEFIFFAVCVVCAAVIYIYILQLTHESKPRY